MTTIELDDLTLCAALRRGDSHAFAQLVEAYHAPLRRLALTFVRTGAVADEVVQETWLGVIRGIHRFEGRSSLKTWIYRILTNTAKARAVREARTVPISSLETDEGPTVDPSRFLDANHDRWPGHWAAPPSRWEEIPEEALLGRETMSIVSEAMDALPELQRRVVVLRDVEGWSAEEVCDLLGLTEVNQRVLLHRGRAKVRARLEEHLT